MRSILAACAALWLVACATEPSAPSRTAAQSGAASSDPASDTICSREYPIGSNIPITKCRTRSQIEAERAAANEGLRRTQAGGPNARPDGR